MVFKEVPKDDSKYEYYKISPLWAYNNPVQLRPIELVLPNGHEIDVESSDLSKGIIRFKRKWLSLEQMYNMAKATNYGVDILANNLSSAKYSNTAYGAKPSRTSIECSVQVDDLFIN